MATYGNNSFHPGRPVCRSTPAGCAGISGGSRPRNFPELVEFNRLQFPVGLRTRFRGGPKLQELGGVPCGSIVVPCGLGGLFCAALGPLPPAEGQEGPKPRRGGSQGRQKRHAAHSGRLQKLRRKRMSPEEVADAVAEQGKISRSRRKSLRSSAAWASTRPDRRRQGSIRRAVGARQMAEHRRRGAESTSGDDQANRREEQAPTSSRARPST